MRLIDENEAAKVKLFLTHTDEIKSLLNQEGLTLTDLKVLIEIAPSNEQIQFITTSQLVKRLGLDRGWVYASVKRLEQKVYISKRSNGFLGSGYLAQSLLKKTSGIISAARKSTL